MSDTPTFERYAGIPLAIGFTVPLPRPLLLSALLVLLIVLFGGGVRVGNEDEQPEGLRVRRRHLFRPDLLSERPERC